MVIKKGQAILATAILGSVLAFAPGSSAYADSITVGWDSSNVVVTNNVSKADTVKVTGLVAGAVVNVYDKEIGGKLIGSGKVPAGATEVTVTVSELGSSAGQVFVAVILETAAAGINFDAEAVTTAVEADAVTVNNYAGLSDTVKVTAAEGQIVKVYDAATGGKLLGSATVAKGQTAATVTIKQIGAEAGKIYVTLTEANKQESTRTEVEVKAEAISTKLTEADVEVANNVGKADTITVKGEAGTVIKVYDEAGTKVLGTATVAKGKESAVVSIAQLGTAATKVQVTATETGKAESEKYEVVVDAEAVTTAVEADDVEVNNYAGLSDTVKVTAAEGQIVKVYDAATGGKLLGSATVAKGQTAATVTIKQIGAEAGKIYVTLTEANKQESTRTEVEVKAEAISTKLTEADVEVANNVGKADTITVKGEAGTVIKVYDEAGTKVLGTATVAKGKESAVVSIAQLGTAATKVQVTATETGKAESEKYEVVVDAEAVTTAVEADAVTVNNYAGLSDTVEVTAAEGQIVKVYDAATGGKLLGSATVAKGQTAATVTIKQIGAEAGKIYVTLTEANKQESTRTEVEVKAEAISTKLTEADVEVANNVGKADTITVKGEAGTVIKVYDEAGTKVLGTATVAKGKESAVVSIAQLGTAATKVQVTATETGKAESEKYEVVVDAEAVTTAVEADDVEVNNYAGLSDTVKVTAAEGQIVKVYDAATEGKLLGSATVAKGQTAATVTIKQIGAEAGKIYVTLTEANKQESTRTEVEVKAEAISTKLTEADVEVANNVGKADTITVKGEAGTVIKVYDEAGTKVLGTATVAKGKESAVVSIAQLGTAATKVQVTATETGKAESEKYEVVVDAEAVTTAVEADAVTVNNYAGLSDTVEVTAAEGQIVKVYDAATGGKLLGSATVAKGQTAATVTIKQIGAEAGKIYVTLTEANKQESTRTEVEVKAEAISTKLTEADVEVANNVGKADTITVKGEAGTVIKVYDEAGTKVLGTATVAKGKESAVVSIAQLGTAATKVQVTATETGKAESEKYEVVVDAEAVTTAVEADDVEVNNYAGLSDTVKVTAAEGQIVKVYDAATGGKLLGSATVAKGQTAATVTIKQIGAEAGKIYVTLTEANKQESTRTEVEVKAEAISTKLTEADVEVANNVGKADTITVKGEAGTVIKVYDEAGTKVLGTATVAKGKESAVVSIAQLGTAATKVQVTATETGKAESEKYEVVVDAEAVTTAVEADDVEVNNYAGLSDTVKVTAAEGQIVKVYDAATGGKLLGSATVAKGQTAATVTIKQIGAEAGKIYVTLTETNKQESTRTEVEVNAEAVSTKLTEADLEATNNVGKVDTIVVQATAGTVIKVYDAAGTKVLGTATVASGKSSATVSISQIGIEKTTVNVSAIETGKAESEKLQIEVDAEEVTDILAEENVEVVVNVGKADTITVSDLQVGDIVKVYKAGTTTVLGTATVASGKSQVIISISQLGVDAGSVDITLTNKGKRESEKLTVSYEAEVVTDAPSDSQIRVTNNVTGTKDTVSVNGLTGGDIVKVYKAGTTTVLGSGTVVAGGSEAVISITQLGTAAGSIDISVTSTNQRESSKVTVEFDAEA